MSTFERVAGSDELKPGDRKSVIVDDTPVLLVRVGDEYFAIEDVCTHDGQPLTDGPIADGEITCPRHGARFDLRTGDARCMPATEPVKTYAVQVRDDAIFVGPGGSHEASGRPASAPAMAVTQETDPLNSSPEEQEQPTAEASGGKVPDELALIEALRQVIDPELMINVVDLGLVYNVEMRNESIVSVDMTLTSPACPAGPQIMQQAKMALELLDGVGEAEINLVMTPPWTPERMTDEARDQLGIF